MSVDYSKKVYYKAVTRNHRDWAAKVFRYDPTGMQEIILYKSGYDYCSRGEAADAAVEWCEEHQIEAHLA